MDDLLGKTILEQERIKKQHIGEQLEMIEEVGQDNEAKGIKAAEQYFREQERVENQARNEAYNILDGMLSLKDKRKSYHEFLTAIVARFCEQEEIPPKVRYQVVHNKEGIILSIQKTNYYVAIKPSYIPPMDYHACKVMAMRYGNQAAKILGFARTTASGLVLADEQDIKKFANGTN